MLPNNSMNLRQSREQTVLAALKVRSSLDSRNSGCQTEFDRRYFQTLSGNSCGSLAKMLVDSGMHKKNYYQKLKEIRFMDPARPAEMDGGEVLKRIREYESESGLLGINSVRIAMATTMGDKDTVMRSFHDQCDGFITKPYTPDSLLRNLRKYRIFPPA